LARKKEGKYQDDQKCIQILDFAEHDFEALNHYIINFEGEILEQINIYNNLY
jgi:hypothetical protein